LLFAPGVDSGRRALTVSAAAASPAVTERHAQGSGGKTLMVVESDAKAEKIGKFLGSQVGLPGDAAPRAREPPAGGPGPRSLPPATAAAPHPRLQYVVMATKGHVRHLPAKEGAVEPGSGFAMTWEQLPRTVPILKRMEAALGSGGCDTLLLATDPDREGEAIAWHVREMLEQARALGPHHRVRRVTFTEVTRDAVARALERPRDISLPLVDAYRARLGLDYLVGFSISPVLWRKMPGQPKSAGRVQSVALRLIAEREDERDAFVPQRHWSIAVQVHGPGGVAVPAKLVSVDGQPASGIGAFESLEDAERVAEDLRRSSVRVSRIKSRRSQRRPDAPFVTSTLQQAGCNRLGMSPSSVMSAAQKLYEGPKDQEGLITYPRTDGTDLSPDATAAIRAAVGELFGPEFVPAAPHTYSHKKAKNAQEAHEAIRPTQVSVAPWDIPPGLALDPYQRRVYDLVWRRSLACQMTSAELETVSADLATDDGRFELRASGTRETFEGFLAAYRVGRAGRDGTGDGSEDERDVGPSTRHVAVALLQVEEGSALQVADISVAEHETSPPPRYNYASLVRAMEEMGIGRPSTYANTIDVLQRRGYVDTLKRRGSGPLVPSPVGRLTSAFLREYFGELVEYEFTAEMEDRLDTISGGQGAAWGDVLGDFWGPFEGRVESTMEVGRLEVLERLGDRFAPLLFPAREDGSDPRGCPRCGKGTLGLKMFSGGNAFLQCDRYGEKVESCGYSLPVLGEHWKHFRDSLARGADEGLPRDLGQHPELGYRMYLKVGPYGMYLEMDSPKGPERTNIGSAAIDDLDAASAAEILALKKGRLIGVHPRTGVAMTLKNGRFGPYVDHDGTYASVPKSLLAKNGAAASRSGGEDSDGEEPDSSVGADASPLVVGLTVEIAAQLVDRKMEQNAARGITPESKVAPKKGRRSAKNAAGPGGAAAPAVKRPKSSYMFFCAEMREAVKAEQPGLRPPEVLKALGEKWRQTSGVDRARFEEMAAADQKRYVSESGAGGAKRRMSGVGAGGGKKPLRGFFLFSQERRPAVREAHPEWKVGDVAKELGRQWRELDDASKDAWKRGEVAA